MSQAQPAAPGPPRKDELERLAQAAARFRDSVGRVIVGKVEAVDLVLIALLCQGHLLLEDVPGLGKTLMAKAAARSLGLSFARIQFTPDLLPSDVTGLNYFNQKTGEFQFLPGPVMANLVLADEINRATPRTQSCLLETMEERQVTVDGQTRPLPLPFMVLATQNPVEQEGTFPLPEAQLDRFLLRISPGYPTPQEEEMILTRFERDNPLDKLQPVLEPPDLAWMSDLCRRVHVENSLRAYLVELVGATRQHDEVRLGASPRAAQGLYQAARARAAMQGRAFVLPDDIKALAGPVLAHRIIVSSQARIGGQGKQSVIQEVLDQVPVPVE